MRAVDTPAVRLLLALCLVLSGAVAALAVVPSPTAADRVAGSAGTLQPDGPTPTPQPDGPTPTPQPDGPTVTPQSDGENASADGGITEVRYYGSGIVQVDRERTFVWQTGNTSLDAVVQPLGDPGDHELCLTLQNKNETTREYGCHTIDVRSYGGSTSFSVDGFGNATGNRTLHLEYQRAGGGDRNDSEQVLVTVITPDGDVDGDSLSNKAEVKHNTSLVDADTDEDGLLDGPEETQYNSSATNPDTDDDGARDGMEIEAGSFPDDPDSDDDGLTDGEELTQFSTDPTDPDTDDDGLSDFAEVNKYDTDPTTADTDSDGLSDSEEIKKYDTDPTVADTDGDGLSDGEEVERGTDPLEETWLDSEDQSPLGRNTLLFAGLGLVLAIGGFAAYLTLDEGRKGSEPEVPPPSSTRSDTPGADGGRPDTPGSVSPSPSGAAPETPPPDPDLLSPEEYIRQLLEANGGYMKQSDIVEQVDWSKATVSRRLSSMEEDGVIERTRMGRGKIVTLPGVELDEMP